jgi:hypothetical protein
MATTDVLRVQGDYLVQAPNGTITLDPGVPFTNTDGNPATTGTVVITGNLDVRGATTTIESITATITDNVITLNSGQPGTDQVSLGTSGIIIDRGNAGDTTYAASILYTDNYAWTFSGATTYKGSFNFTNKNTGAAIKINAIRLGNNAPKLANNVGTSLSFFGAENPTSVLSVHGTTNYESYCGLDKDNIPNVQYVLDQIVLGAQTPPNIRKLQQLNSAVTLTDDGVNAPSVTINLGGPNVQYTFKSDGEFRIDGQNASLSILDNSIGAVATTATHAPLVLSAYGGDPIKLQSYIVMKASPNTAVAWTSALNNLGVGDTIVYSSATTAVSGGGTNLFFVNSNNKLDPTTNTVIAEELVSRKKALVYAIVF